ncbi:TRZ/ATZ family hydrolase [Marinihelvus fidelis]|uniref:5-methylthioadenosine/S-adenosylhomocysteine deaminase n=1 Tax=Marinihelvus fidelis TaxID=2613842 RepID=A0A5N0TBS8_9GAMM|nr:TRZ/ATZ family hydrolase [Marinihelvus fidelis]KAA9131874.1 TRZ/ATZ family hydrolase [Marinihelvus fidelis]
MSASMLLLPRYLLPVRPARELQVGMAVRVVDGNIDAVLPRAEALARFPEDRRVELDRHVLMPGLVNMHTHSPMALLRGYADDLALDTWLQDHIWPAEGRWVSEAFVRDGTRLAMAEMIRGGTTCFNEMYFFPREIARVAAEAGVRAVIGNPVIDVPTPWASGIDQCLALAESLSDMVEAEPLLDMTLAPHAPYTVDDAGLSRVAELSATRGWRVNMHVLEAGWEVARSQEMHGEDTLSRMDRLGLLSPDFVAVHMVHLTAADIELVAERGVHVVHCPESNLKLASGISPVAQLLAAGVNVAVGTDGAASNNDLDLLGELRTAALLAKGSSGDPAALDAWAAIEMATLSGARALGLGDRLGSIEPGKAADLAAMDLSAPETQPEHHVQSQVVYAANSRQFSHVWVAGKALMEEGELTTLDVDRVVARAAEWDERLAVRAA